MKTALVTGATGFLGNALVETLLEKGYRVIGIGRRSKGFLSNATLYDPRFIFLNFDLTKDCADALSGYAVNVIFHLAARQPASGLGFEDFYAGNVETTRSVIQYAKQAGVSQLVYISSLSVFGNDPGVHVLNEEDIPIPKNYYGLTKYIAERLIEIELLGSNVQATVVRFPSLYGRNHLGGIMYAYYELAKEGKPIEVYGKGESVRNALYVDDAVDVLCRVAEKRDALAHFEVFFAGSLNSLPMTRIAECVKEYSHSSSEVVLIDKPSSPYYDMNIEKAKRLLGFDPMTLEEGIKKYIDDIITHV